MTDDNESCETGSFYSTVVKKMIRPKKYFCKKKRKCLRDKVIVSETKSLSLCLGDKVMLSRRQNYCLGDNDFVKKKMEMSPDNKAKRPDHQWTFAKTKGISFQSWKRSGFNPKKKK
jgi:hypothetical protein